MINPSWHSKSIARECHIFGELTSFWSILHLIRLHTRPLKSSVWWRVGLVPTGPFPSGWGSGPTTLSGKCLWRPHPFIKPQFCCVWLDTMQRESTGGEPNSTCSVTQQRTLPLQCSAHMHAACHLSKWPGAILNCATEHARENLCGGRGEY